MARLAPPSGLRWRQAVPGSVDVTWGGGEANVSASLAMFGESVRFVTALPKQPISEALRDTLRGLGVDTSQILWRDGRLGLYFVEVGSNQRGSTVVYDRSDSAVSLAGIDEYDFDAILSGVHHLHVTGITPAISENAYRVNMALVQKASEENVTVSCDLNFRKKLWNWRPGTSRKELARECMAELLSHVDLVIANEEDAADVLDIHAAGSDVEHGQIDATAYEQVAREIVARFANVSRVAITLRESISANHNNWGALLFEAVEQKSYLAPLNAQAAYQPYEIRHIVDRVGAGDSFVAGLLHAFASKDFADPQRAIQFAVAASCLKHTVKGDFNYATHDEVAALVAGASSGRVQR
ncbi:MAG: sugar kinase [Planctomycetes bacterium]|nr:sugar kinase [Planctomycetota bacterium]